MTARQDAKRERSAATLKHPMTHDGHSGTRESAAQPATRFLVDNEPLPEVTYPSTALKHENEYAAEALRPVWLQDVDHLAEIVAESRDMIGVSNFAEISTPRNSARTLLSPHSPDSLRQHLRDQSWARQGLSLAIDRARARSLICRILSCSM